MAQITVTTTELSRKMDELQNSNNQLNQQIEQLKGQENNLCSLWEGEARDKFDQEFKNDVQQMMDFHKAIGDYVAKLGTIINAYNDAERRNLEVASNRTF